MRKNYGLVFIAVAALFSVLALADSITVGGRQAETLFNTFYDLGIGGCGNGNCGVAVTEFKCTQPKDQRRSECTMVDAVGGGEIYFDDRDADRLTTSVRNAGVKAKCDDQSCVVTAQRIRCARDTASTGRPMYYCSIDL